MKKLINTKIGKCSVQDMPIFRSELAKMLFFYICSDTNVCEAGIDDQRNIYFAYLNGSVSRFNRADFLKLAKKNYVSVDFTLKNENGNHEYLGPSKILNIVSYCQKFQIDNDTFEQDDYMETGYMFVKNIGHWNGMNWTGKRFLVHKDFLKNIIEDDYQSICWEDKP